MLSSVLNSPRAIATHIEMMRVFVQVRSMAATHQDLAKQLVELQDKTESLAMSHETLSRNNQFFAGAGRRCTQLCGCPPGRLMAAASFMPLR